MRGWSTQGRPPGKALLPLLRGRSASIGGAGRISKALLSSRLPLRALLLSSALRLLLPPPLSPASQPQPRRRGAEEKEGGGLGNDRKFLYENHSLLA